MWCGRNCGDALCLCGQRAAAAIVGFRGERDSWRVSGESSAWCLDGDACM